MKLSKDYRRLSWLIIHLANAYKRSTLFFYSEVVMNKHFLYTIKQSDFPQEVKYVCHTNLME